MKSIENFELEKSIKAYKTFYKKYLLNINNREDVLNELHDMLNKLRSSTPRIGLVIDSEQQKLEYRINNFLKNNLNEALFKLYNKELPTKSKKNVQHNEENTLLISLIITFAQTFENLNEKNKQELNYKTNFIWYLYSCFRDYGLHPNILKRNPISDKKFNLVLKHFYRNKNKISDCRIMMSYDVFERDFVTQYTNKKPIKINGKLIPFEDIYEVKITTTFLKEDEIELFALKNKFKWGIGEQRDVSEFISYCVDETDTYHPNPFEETTHHNDVNQLYIQEIKFLLAPYQDSLKLYASAIEKHSKNIYTRNVLDDLRLSLEILLKEILGNSKSLENQRSHLGTYQKERGATNEVTNMFQKLVDYYTKYQNNYIKHNDDVQASEIGFVIDLTTTFLKYLLK